MNIPLHMKRPRVLIVGCGDIGQRVARMLAPRYRVLALARSADSAARLRQSGVLPVRGDLDQMRSLSRLAGLAHHVIHLAPPPLTGCDDPRTRRLLAHLSRRAARAARANRAIVAPGRLIYISTSGVYGDCGGSWVDESRACNPESTRARRRVAAERQIRRLGQGGRWQTAVVRVPGIHGVERLPLQRLRGGQPVMHAAEDSWGNHVDADDLAAAIVCLLSQSRPQRIYNCCDSDPQPMGQYLNQLCRALGLPPLPAMSRSEIEQHITPSLWSFQRESRRLRNTRLLQETRWRPLTPTVGHLLRRLSGTALANPAPSAV